MEKRKDYKEIKNLDENGNNIELVSRITNEDGKIYFLCEDGNFYEKIEENKFKKIDSTNEKLVKELRELFHPGFTDVIRD